MSVDVRYVGGVSTVMMPAPAKQATKTTTSVFHRRRSSLR